MRIEHIFNEVKKEGNNNKKFIYSQEFEISYIKDFIKLEREEKKERELFEKKLKDKSKAKQQMLEEKRDDDFGKKYYGSLIPCEDDIISKYDNEKLNNLVDKLGDNLLLISGDFWGIQKFIFDGLTANKASKILRSRSAMVQLITFAIVDIIKNKFPKSDTVLFGAGKFLILAKNDQQPQTEINKIQKELNNYFLQNFFGLNGFILSVAQTNKQNILAQNSEEMKINLDNLAKKNELNKLQKFNFTDLEDNNICIDIFANNDNEVCKFCGKRGVEKTNKNEACSVCDNQIKLGEKLTKNDYIEISTQKREDDILIIELSDIKYYAKFYKDKPLNNRKNIFDMSVENYDIFPKWSLNSYVAKNEDKIIKDFDELCINEEGNKSSGLMAMKADVDKLGDTFRDFYQNNFKKFNRLSRELDFFFSDYATSLMKDKNLYTVFAGGDDLFVIGEYNEIIKYAKELRDNFYKFSLEKSTLSMGIVMFKPSTPINYISRLADEAESRAKAVLKDEDKNKTDEKKSKLTRDGIDLFGISMKFNEFLDIENNFEKVIEFLEKEDDDKSTFYYRLIELCDMRENLKSDEIDYRNAMWKSKLNYLFRRNVKKEDNDSRIFNKLNCLIEKYGKKFKPSIFLKIYKNREKNEKRIR